MALTVVLREGKVEIPNMAQHNLAAFRKWAKSDALPEKVRTDFYKGEVWIDMGTEQVFSHGAVKTAFARVLANLLNLEDGDLFLINGILVSNLDAELSGNPDMVYVSASTLDAGRVKMIGAATEGYTELEGSPDMVLEIVSPGSEKKDTVTLRKAYWEAGIPEYWLMDARGTNADFRILRHGSKGYVDVRKLGGWQKSGVFGRSFRLSRSTGRRGDPTFTLEVK